MKEDPMEPKKVIIVAQLFISGMMALFMSGVMSVIHMGFSAAWLAQWGPNFLTAWPIAFVASMVVGPIGFALARRVLRVEVIV
jgi:hypothetical protein